MPQTTIISPGATVRRTLCAVLLMVGSCAASGQRSGCAPGGGPGRWAKTATDLDVSSSNDPGCQDEESRDIRVYSPDRSKLVHVVGDQWWVETGKRRISLDSKARFIGYPAELGWAPDNRTFFITQSSGSFGQFFARIYRIQENEIEVFADIGETVLRHFDRQYACVVTDNGKRKLYGSNIAAFRWMDRGNQLLLVAEVPPDNICEHASYFAGYLVSIPEGRIIERYTPQELAHRWISFFGIRLKGDYDTVIEKQPSKEKGRS